MSQQGTLGLWLREYEQHHGGVRAAAEHYSIDPGNWIHLREGRGLAEPRTLEKLGLRVCAVLYEKGEPK